MAGPAVVTRLVPILVAMIAGQRRLAEAGRAIEEHVIDALPTLLGRLTRPAGLATADPGRRTPRRSATQRALERRVVRRAARLRIRLSSSVTLTSSLRRALAAIDLVETAAPAW